MITKKQADDCTTHHNACDCLQYRKEQMEKALESIYNWTVFASRQKTLLSVTGIQEIKNVAAVGLGLKKNREVKNG